MSEESTRYVPWDVYHSYAEKVESEFARRDDENDRQNHRLSDLESTVKEIGRLTVSVEKMAVSMESMTTEQKRTSDRLSELEKKPAKHWETVITGILGAIAGAIGAAIMSGVLH